MIPSELVAWKLFASISAGASAPRSCVALYAKNMLLTVGVQIAIQLIGLLTGILVARLLGPSGRGELAAIITWVYLLSYLGNLGLPVAYTYAAARAPHRTPELLGNGVLATFLQWPVLALLGMVVLPLVLHAYGTDVADLAVLYLVWYVPLNLLTLYAIGIQQGLGHYTHFNAVRLCVPVTYLGGLALIQCTSNSCVVAANLLSNFVALALALTLLVPVLWKGGAAAGPWLRLTGLRSDLRYGVSAHLGSIQPFSGLRIDVVLLTLVCNAYELGIYVAALAAATIIKAQGAAIGMVLMPEVAKQSEVKGQRKLIARSIAVVVLMSGSPPCLRHYCRVPCKTGVRGRFYRGCRLTTYTSCRGNILFAPPRCSGCLTRYGTPV